MSGSNKMNMESSQGVQGGGIEQGDNGDRTTSGPGRLSALSRKNKIAAILLAIFLVAAVVVGAIVVTRPAPVFESSERHEVAKTSAAETDRFVQVIDGHRKLSGWACENGDTNACYESTWTLMNNRRSHCSKHVARGCAARKARENDAEDLCLDLGRRVKGWVEDRLVRHVREVGGFEESDPGVTCRITGTKSSSEHDGWYEESCDSYYGSPRQCWACSDLLCDWEMECTRGEHQYTSIELYDECGCMPWECNSCPC